WLCRVPCITGHSGQKKIISADTQVLGDANGGLNLKGVHVAAKEPTQIRVGPPTCGCRQLPLRHLLHDHQPRELLSVSESHVYLRGWCPSLLSHDRNLSSP